MEQYAPLFCLGSQYAVYAFVLPDGHWTKIEDRSKIFELLALVNEELWVGHFSYWTEQNIPVFKHSVILNDGEDIESKISQIIDIAIKECERMYPIFKVVLTKGMDPKQALYPMMMATVGQA